jgi:hypothetical protein
MVPFFHDIGFRNDIRDVQKDTRKLCPQQVSMRFLDSNAGVEIGSPATDRTQIPPNNMRMQLTNGSFSGLRDLVGKKILVVMKADQSGDCKGLQGSLLHYGRA